MVHRPAVSHATSRLARCAESLRTETCIMTQLYDQPFPAKRIGPLYNAFSYATKIDPEVIGVFVAAHTAPGDTVLDVFGGSGTTGIATALCDRPTDRMRLLAEEAGVTVEWGPRTAHIYELSPIGALVGEVMSSPCDPAAFRDTARRILVDAASEVGEWYEAEGPDGTPGRIRYVVWSELIQTPCCEQQLSVYEATVRLDPAVIESEFLCAGCGRTVRVNECARVSEIVVDPLTGESVERRQTRPGARLWAKWIENLVARTDQGRFRGHWSDAIATE